MSDEEAGTCVFLNTEQAEEGDEAGTPVTCICEGGQVESGMDGIEVIRGESLGRLREVGVSIQIGDTSPHSVEGAVAWQRRVTEAEDVVVDCG